MTLVVEIEKSQINQAEAQLKKFLPDAESQLDLGKHTLRYYQVNKENDDTLIINVMNIQGVLSAYFKPEGAPPK
ncbi:MAG: hypothetical protein ABI151_06160 [Chitinophagaceae bacterium]